MSGFNDGGLIYTQSYQPGTIIDSNALVYTGASQVGGNFFYLDVGSSGLTVKHNCTKGCSFSFGIGMGTFDMLIDSNYIEWPNHTSSNGTPINEPTCNVYITNVFMDGVNQAVMENVGIHEDEIELTPVSVMPGNRFTAMRDLVSHSGSYSIYNIKGQRIMKIDMQMGIDKALPGLKKVLPPGAYLVAENGIESGITRKILFR
jgi:hypothetical protein